jgi:hypothetical protein
MTRPGLPKGVPANIVRINQERKLHNAARNRRIVDLRIAGMSEQAIADAITADSKYGSISDTQVHRIINAYLDRENKVLDSKYEQLRRIELKRLDQITMALFANRGIPEHANALLRIMDRRARLLGLDAPIKVDNVNKNEQIGEVKHKIDWDKLPTEDLVKVIEILEKTGKVPDDSGA